MSHLNYMISCYHKVCTANRNSTEYPDAIKLQRAIIHLQHIKLLNVKTCLQRHFIKPLDTDRDMHNSALNNAENTTRLW
jgi:hypothetical protein